jgi:hypothetical protein
LSVSITAALGKEFLITYVSFATSRDAIAITGKDGLNQQLAVARSHHHPSLTAEQ